MFRPIDQLQVKQIKNKLQEELSLAHISLWLAHRVIVRELNSYSEQTPEEFIEEMCDNLILDIDEKDEILAKILPNQPVGGLEHFCKCLQKKDIEDVKAFLEILFKRVSLIPLAVHFQSVIQRCEEIQQQRAVQPIQRDTGANEVHYDMTVRLKLPQHHEEYVVERVKTKKQEFIDGCLQLEVEVTMVKKNSITCTFRVMDAWDLADIHSDITSGVFKQRFIFWLEDLGLNLSAEEERSVGAEITAISRETEVNKAKDTPPPVDYLDCEQMQDGVFSLKWRLPQGRVPITNSILEMKDESGEWKPLDGPFKGNSFIFKGAAVEFRVAAVNEFGTGPYTYCTPSTDIAIYKLLPKDREAIESNLELFSQMKHIERITSRLCDRSVLHENTGKEVRDYLNKAARTLVDEICNCTYKELYLFKKTLTEFDQEHLAALLPIKTIDEYNQEIGIRLRTRAPGEMMGSQTSGAHVDPERQKRIDIVKREGSDGGATNYPELLKPRDESKDKLSKLCDSCRLTVARKTLRRRDVISTLAQVDRSFCCCLSDNIIDRDMRQRILTSVTDEKALNHIRDALDDCQDPNMINELLEVLRQDSIGKTMHADRIEQAYNKEIEQHQPCGICNISP